MNIPTFDQAKAFVGNILTAVQVFTSKGATLNDQIKAGAALAGNVLDVVAPPGLTVLGFSPSKVLATVADLADAKDGPATPLAAAFSELQAAVSGAPAPVDAVWTKFNALADQKHADWKAALAAA